MHKYIGCVLSMIAAVGFLAGCKKKETAVSEEKKESAEGNKISDQAMAELNQLLDRAQGKPDSRYI